MTQRLKIENEKEEEEERNFCGAWKWKSAINFLLFLQFTVCAADNGRKRFSWKAREGKEIEKEANKMLQREKKSWINLPYTLSFVFLAAFFSLAVGRGKVNLFHGIKDLFVLRWSRVCIQSEKCLIWKLIFEQIGSHIFFCAYHKDNPFYNFSSLCSWNRANNSKAIFQAIIFQQKLKAFFHFSISCFFT